MTRCTRLQLALLALLALLVLPAGASAEAGAASDAGSVFACSCNDRCGTGNVCVQTGMGARMCCPDAVDGCPANPGPGIPCPDAGPVPVFDAGPGPVFDAGAPSGMSGGGCTVTSRDSAAPGAAWLAILVGAVFGLRSRRG